MHVVTLRPSPDTPEHTSPSHPASTPTKLASEPTSEPDLSATQAGAAMNSQIYRHRQVGVHVFALRPNPGTTEHNTQPPSQYTRLTCQRADQ